MIDKILPAPILLALSKSREALYARREFCHDSVAPIMPESRPAADLWKRSSTAQTVSCLAIHSAYLDARGLYRLNLCHYTLTHTREGLQCKFYGRG